MDVVCLGILVADMFASPMESLPEAGELKAIDHYLLSVGGCAANTAVDLRRLGRSVEVIGKVGPDMFGDFVIRELERHGARAANIRRSPALPTSSTVILNVHGQDRRYIHCIGANADFSPADLDLAVLAGSRILYVGGYLAMPGFSPDDLGRLFHAAHERSLMTVLDVVIPAGLEVSLDHVRPVLPHTDYFLPNQDEARRLTGLDAPEDQAARLATLNPACTIVITRGARGSLTKHGEAFIATPAFQVDAVDESGAGDAFAAGFITGLLENWPLEYTLSFAAAAGASCTRALGCHNGVFGFDDAIAFTAAHGRVSTASRRL